MDERFTLPAEVVYDASISGNEYGWPPELFPDAARRAESLGYACVGGQFQFRTPVGTCEMYWLSADSTGKAADRRLVCVLRAITKRGSRQISANHIPNRFHAGGASVA